MYKLILLPSYKDPLLSLGSSAEKQLQVLLLGHLSPAPLRGDGCARGRWQQKCFGCFLLSFSIYRNSSQCDRRLQFWMLSRLPHFLKESLLLCGTAPCLGTMTLYPPLNNCLISPRGKNHHRPVLSWGFGQAPACAISLWKGQAVKGGF